MIKVLKMVQSMLIALLIVLPWYALFVNLILIDIRRLTEYAYALLLGLIVQLIITLALWKNDHILSIPIKVFVGIVFFMVVVGSFLVHYLPLRLL